MFEYLDMLYVASLPIILLHNLKNFRSGSVPGPTLDLLSQNVLGWAGKLNFNKLLKRFVATAHLPTTPPDPISFFNIESICQQGSVE
jgi:hypothetical protein